MDCKKSDTNERMSTHTHTHTHTHSLSMLFPFIISWWPLGGGRVAGCHLHPSVSDERVERSKALSVYPNSFPTILSPDCLRAFAHAIHYFNPHFISSSLKCLLEAVPDHSVKNNSSQLLPLSRSLLLLFSH